MRYSLPQSLGSFAETLKGIRISSDLSVQIFTVFADACLSGAIHSSCFRGTCPNLRLRNVVTRRNSDSNTVLATQMHLLPQLTVSRRFTPQGCSDIWGKRQSEALSVFIRLISRHACYGFSSLPIYVFKTKYRQIYGRSVSTLGNFSILAGKAFFSDFLSSSSRNAL